MPMYNLIEYSDNFLATTASLQQIHKDEPKNSINAEIAEPLKYFSKIWRTLAKPLINCKINLILIWPEKCVISEIHRVTTFIITDNKHYVPVVTLSSGDNENYYNNQNQVLKEQLTGINVYQKINRKTKTMFKLLNSSKLSRSNQAFCVIIS